MIDRLLKITNPCFFKKLSQETNIHSIKKYLKSVYFE